ncbi:WG repeat-containing protein [Dyadobacter sp. CY343]|uniref:WG repeat-containing protein n=1 Tax=Dyadobacter sp. CY343 TaxID=2907299 RepID=UPI001F1ACF17|nr:WG repeat-containing protein [Dyadobacter sp. CY343]MCE7059228.1 WG repeat-containing protein [Dyadobacter sp. CY343]
MFASSRIFGSVFSIFLLLTTASHLLGQTSRTITKADENKIKQEARKLIGNLEFEYDFFLTETALQRRSRLAALITPGAGRIFFNDKVIVENDFYDADIKDLEKSARDKPVEDYFNELSDKFGAHDNGDDPNQGKQVKINLTKVSRVQAVSDADSMYIKVAFEVTYDGKARNGYAFKPVDRVAELRLEREGRNWRPYISSIRFLDSATGIENRTRNVGIVEQILGVDIKFADVINTPDIKNVSRSPVLLKAFNDNDLWGLLIDEDNDKRVLVQPIFCEINEFIDNRSLVCQDGKWGCIDKSGRIVIDCIYDLPFSFVKGKAQVQLGGRAMTIDTNGKVSK